MFDQRQSLLGLKICLFWVNMYCLNLSIRLFFLACIEFLGNLLFVKLVSVIHETFPSKVWFE